MKNVLNDVNQLENLIRQLNKLSSRIRAGEIVDAYRECNGLMAMVTKQKQELLEEVAKNLPKE